LVKLNWEATIYWLKYNLPELTTNGTNHVLFAILAIKGDISAL
jgi:hypothetical protein